MDKNNHFINVEMGEETRLDKLQSWLINNLGMWITLDWWRYVLDDSRCFDKWRGNDELFNGRLYWWLSDRWPWLNKTCAYLFRCQCRARNHPYGVGWYNVGGYEPDMTCQGCGEDLG